LPPTEKGQLPPDYLEKYAKGLPPEKVRFNPTKTWIEYANRLLGALTGVFIFIAAAVAWYTFGFNRTTQFSVIATVLTGVQGYIGAKVVSTVLAPVIISVHMLLAQVIVFLLLAALWQTLGRNVVLAQGQAMRFWSAIMLTLFFSQLFLGVAVRQQVDYMTNTLLLPKQYIVQNLTWQFYLHRSFSIVLVTLTCYLGIVFHKNESSRLIKNLWVAAILVTLAEAVFGASLYYYSLPAALQALHLLFASLLLGILFSILLISSQNKAAQTVAI
jgi:cytochrome c oxidase assembly protein subunit 15